MPAMHHPYRKGGLNLMMKPITKGTLKQPLRELSIPERYAVWRYLTHLVDHAVTNPSWRAQLTSLDIASYPAETVALIRAILEDNPAAIRYIEPSHIAAILDAKPCDPPIRLTEGKSRLRIYRDWGFLI